MNVRKYGGNEYKSYNQLDSVIFFLFLVGDIVITLHCLNLRGNYFRGVWGVMLESSFSLVCNQVLCKLRIWDG